MFRQDSITAVWRSLFVLSLIWGATLSSASAETGSDESKLLVLVEEAIEMPDRQKTRFWWSSPSSPVWTQTDRALRESMKDSNLAWADPSGTNVSRIYRTRQLSRSRATAFASVVDADFAVKGRIVFSLDESKTVYGLKKLEATAQIELFSSHKRDEFSRSFSLKRHRFTRRPNREIQSLRKEFARAITSQIEGFLEQHKMPIGIDYRERLIGLEEVRNVAHFRKVRAFLSSLDSVQTAGVNWASEGIIGLEVNPGKEDSSTITQKVLKKLKSKRFERFRLERTRSRDLESVSTFRVIPKN